MKMEWNDISITAPTKRASYLVNIPQDQSWGPPKNCIKVAEYNPHDKIWRYTDTYGPPVEIASISHWMEIPEVPSSALKMFHMLEVYFNSLGNDSKADDATWPMVYTGIDVFCTYNVNEAKGATNGNIILTLSENKMANCVFYCHSIGGEYLTKLDFTFDKYVMVRNGNELTIWFGANFIKIVPNKKIRKST